MGLPCILNLELPVFTCNFDMKISVSYRTYFYLKFIVATMAIIIGKIPYINYKHTNN